MNDIYDAWNESTYPFDRAKDSQCLTQEAVQSLSDEGLETQRGRAVLEVLSAREVDILNLSSSERVKVLSKHFDELLAIRKKFDKDYPPMPASEKRQQLAICRKLL